MRVVPPAPAFVSFGVSLWVASWVVVGTSIGAAPAAAAAPPVRLCYGPDGRAPVVGPGQEAEVEALFAPYKDGAPLGEVAPGWVLRSLSVDRDAIRADLVGPGDAHASLTLRPHSCVPALVSALATIDTSPSFVALGVPALEAPGVSALMAAVTRNDRGGFWRTWAVDPQRAVASRDPATPPGGQPDEEQGEDARPTRRRPLSETVGGVALLLALAALALLADLPRAVRELTFSRPHGGRVALAVLGLTLAGWLLRVWIAPTFIREAYSLQLNPYAAWMNIPDGTLSAYPRGPDVLVGVWARLFGGAPYDVWFSLHATLGALTVPLSYLATVALTRSRGAGLAAAAVLAFLPQHVRLSASESVHVTLIFWGVIAVGWAALAARNGRLRSFAAAALAAGAVVVSRPEGALLGPALLVIAWSTPGSGVRRNLTSPVRLALLAGIVWLLAPSVAAITTDASIQHFIPGSHTGEGLGWGTLLHLPMLIVWPDGHNGLFDVATSPLWVWPLALWGGVVLWRRGGRHAAAGLALGLVVYLLLYAGMAPSVTIWKMTRYHGSLLPAAVPLVGLGLWDAVGRAAAALPPAWAVRLAGAGPRAAAAISIAAVGLLAWWPAMTALPRDWQRDLQWALKLGATEPALADPDVRVVLPDNRRRFLDLTPRKLIEPLTQGHQPLSASVTVAEALGALHAHGDDTPAVYYEGLYCWLAVTPGEPINPQCRAMHEGFELIPLREMRVDEPAYLSAYAEVRPAGPLTLTLYRIGRRLPGADAALAGLPAPLTGRLAHPVTPVVGSGTNAYMAPASPPIGVSPRSERFCGWERYDPAAPGPCPEGAQGGR